MSTLSRKQREIREREQLILDAAQQLLMQQGFSQLTMERIAETVEYSKGTIYNHFASKEDLVCSLCCRCIGNLIELFQAAYDYPGCTRERYSAIGIAYSLYNQRKPLDNQYIQIIKNHAVRDRISADKLTQMESLEQQVTGIAQSIVSEAVHCGDLAVSKPEQVGSIVFGGWAMHYGAHLLDQSDIPLQELGFSPVLTMLWENTNRLLDGYGWRPHSHDIDTDAWLQAITENLLQHEQLQQPLQATGT